MTQADRVLSTPPTNTSALSENATNRRTFLAQAAGSVAFMASACPAVATPDDPIFSAIAIHRSAVSIVTAQVNIHCELERSLARSKRLTRIDAYEAKLFDADDPLWIDNERAVAAAFDAETAPRHNPQIAIQWLPTAQDPSQPPMPKR